MNARRVPAAIGNQLHLAVWLLAAGQMIVWAGLFYSFAALLLIWETSLGWSKTELAVGFTIALLVAASASPLTGRIIDAGFGRLLLGGSALFGAFALALLAMVRDQTMFLVVWALIGLAHAGCLYEPCFAFVTRTMGTSARAAITRITLCAGFASALAFPLGAWLSATLGWRGAVIIFATGVAVLGVPLLVAGASLLQRNGETAHNAPPRATSRAAVRAAMGRREFWLLAIAFPLIALNHGILLNHVIPILVDRGLTEAMAVTVASLIGPAQVAGRLAMMRFDHRVSAVALSVVAFAGLSLAAGVLFLAGTTPLLAFVFAATQGATYGVTYILKPVITAESLGTTGFGGISGLLAVPNLAAFAVAPFIGAALWQFGGYSTAIAAAGLAALLGLAAIAILAVMMRRSATQVQVDHGGPGHGI
ncbi:MAG: MFS transporter [Alphaproteobacteria bacterium]|nr:MFS transporter [Alphaproteobacteria bacterium]